MTSGSTLYPQGDTASLRGREEIFYPAAAGDSSPVAAAAAAVAAEAEVDQARAWTSGIPGTHPIAQDSELDEWKDYSCSTAWEYFINDVDNAIGKLVGADKCSPVGEEKQLAGEPRRRLQRPERLVMPLTYKGRSYVLRRLKHGRKRDCRQADTPPAASLSPGAIDFPGLPRYIGEEERALDALLATGHQEESASEEELVEEEEAYRLLASWFGLEDFFSLHESGSGMTKRSSSEYDGCTLSLEQLLSTGVLAMEDRRCGTVLALQKPPTGRRDSKKQGVFAKGYVVLPSPPSRGDSRWTRKAESIRLESATSSDLPPGRRSLEAFGELLEHKALACWGRRGEGGRLEASARYTWERRAFDDRVMEEGDREACQTEWRDHFWRERSHQRRGTRDRAIRALLAQAGGESGAPSWGPEKDPLESIRVTALCNGLGGDRPLPHAPLEMLDGGFLEGGEAMEWTASVSWEASARVENSSLGFKLRLMLATYVHCLALDGDLLMSDLSGASTEVDPSPALERARHIGAVLGPSTRELIERMRRSLPLRDGDRNTVGEGDHRMGAELAEIVRTTRYLLTPRTTTPLSSFSHRERREPWSGGTRAGHRQQQHHQQQPKQQPPLSPSPTVATETPGEEDESSLAPRTPTTPVLPTPGLSPQGFRPRTEGVNVARREGRDPSPSAKVEPVRKRGVTPWLWVPRGGSPACRMVSLVALEAARFGAQGICLGDMADFWKSFVQELRFLWEEGASVPSMDPEPSVDGYGMYDPANSGQDATPAAYFRKHVAPSAAAAAAAGGTGTEMAEGGGRPWGAGEGARPWSRSGSWGKIGVVGGGMMSPPLMPPPPDMRTSLLHQKLQMLNCCVAEQNRSRSVASSRKAYAGVVPPGAANGGSGSGVGSTKLDAEGRKVGASSETSRYADGAAAGADDGGRAGSAEGGMREKGVAVREGLSAIPGGSGKAGSSSGGGKEVATVVESPEERSARMRATFAAERDAILRRVGVKKDSATNGAGAGGGRPWGVTGQGRHRLAEKEKQREASSSSAPAPRPSPSSSFSGKAEDNDQARIGVDASALGAHHREEKRERQHPTAAGDSGEGSTRAIDPSGQRSEYPSPAPLQSASPGGTRRRAVQRADSARRKVGRAVRAVRRSVRVRSTRSIADESVNSVNGNGGGNRERSGLECVPGGDAGNGAEMKESTGEADAESRVWGVGGSGATGGGVDNSDSDTAAATASAGADGCGGVEGVFDEAVEAVDKAVDGVVDGASAGVRAGEAAEDVTFTGDCLLATGVRVVVPELLPACPLTSDMLEQQIELARRLRFRSESDGAKTEVYNTRVSRVRLATLAADMRCFLGANPGAVFADFLRWYSPQNWRPGSERRQARRAPGFRASTWAKATSSSGCGADEPLEGASSSDKGGDIVLVDDTSDDRGVENRTTPDEAAVVCLDEAASTSKPKLDGGSGAPPGWRVFVPKRCGRPRGDTLDAPSPAAEHDIFLSPSSSSSSSSCCRLNWGQQGEVVWRSAADVGDQGDGGGGGIDQEEGVEWAETWVLEAENALSAGGDGGDEGFSRQRPLFNPSQEAEKALHYLETMSPAPLVSQLLLALACTAGFALSEAQTDAASLPCVRAAVSRVNAAIATASEGLSEASASGGVLLMDNRVAHPVSQGTLVACDALCDAVDKAEVLLSRGTSLIHKLPGEGALVEALVTGDVANGCRTIPRQENFASVDGGTSDGRSGDDGLGALVRYLSSGVPVFAFSMPVNSALDGNVSPPPNAGDQRRQLSRGDQLEAGEVHPPSNRRMDITPVEVAGGEEVVGTGNRGVNSSVEDGRGREVEVAAANSGASTQTETSVVSTAIHAAETATPSKTSVPTSAAGGILSFAPSVMPKERVREYSIRWRLPAVVSHRTACKCKELMKAVDQEEEDEGIGARMYARVTVGGSKPDDGNDDGLEGGATDVRVAVSVAEPGRTC